MKRVEKISFVDRLLDWMDLYFFGGEDSNIFEDGRKSFETQKYKVTKLQRWHIEVDVLHNESGDNCRVSTKIWTNSSNFTKLKKCHDWKKTPSAKQNLKRWVVAIIQWNFISESYGAPGFPSLTLIHAQVWVSHGHMCDRLNSLHVWMTMVVLKGSHR